MTDNYGNASSISGRIYEEEIYFFQNIIYSHMKFENTIKSFQEKIDFFLNKTKLKPEQATFTIYFDEYYDISGDLEGKRKITLEELEKYLNKSTPFLVE